MKKPLNIDGVITNADDTIFTLGVSTYPNGNMKLTLQANGEPYWILSLNIEDVLPRNCVAINPNEEHWVKTLIYQNNLGNFVEYYYLSLDNGGVKCTIYSLDRFSLSEFSKDEYEKYVHTQQDMKVIGLSKSELTKKFKNSHSELLARMNKNAYQNGKKPKPKSYTRKLYWQRVYRHRKDIITAILPKGMKEEIEKYGEKASTVLKRELLNYLDKQEKKGE